jgi:hypothetical protein
MHIQKVSFIFFAVMCLTLINVQGAALPGSLIRHPKFEDVAFFETDEDITYYFEHYVPILNEPNEKGFKFYFVLAKPQYVFTGNRKPVFFNYDIDFSKKPLESVVTEEDDRNQLCRLKRDEFLATARRRVQFYDATHVNIAAAKKILEEENKAKQKMNESRKAQSSDSSAAAFVASAAAVCEVSEKLLAAAETSSSSPSDSKGKKTSKGSGTEVCCTIM